MWWKVFFLLLCVCRWSQAADGVVQEESDYDDPASMGVEEHPVEVIEGDAELFSTNEDNVAVRVVQKQSYELRRYAECMARRKLHFETTKQLTVKVVVAVQGQEVKLPCFQCPSPAQRVALAVNEYIEPHGPMAWIRKAIPDQKRFDKNDTFFGINVATLGSGFVQDSQSNLYIKRVDRIAAGFYRCVENDESNSKYLTMAQSVYFVDVMRDLPTKIDLLPSKVKVVNGKQQRDRQMRIIKDLESDGDLYITDEWSSWTEPIRCGSNATERRRRSICVLVAKPSYVNGNKISEELRYMFRLFNTSIPCVSSVLPLEIREKIFKTHQHFHIEQVVDVMAPCPKREPTYILMKRDPAKNNEPKEVDRFEPNEYTLDEQLPPLLKVVYLLKEYAVFGEPLIMSCDQEEPGAKYWKMQVAHMQDETLEYDSYTDKKMGENLLLTAQFLLDRYGETVFIDADFTLHFLNTTLEMDQYRFRCYTARHKEIKVIGLTVELQSLLRQLTAYTKLVIGFMVVVLIMMLVTTKTRDLSGDMRKVARFSHKAPPKGASLREVLPTKAPIRQERRLT